MLRIVLLFLFSLLLLLTACTSRNNAGNAVAGDSLKVADTAKMTLADDTFQITEPRIIFTNPSDDSVAAMIAKDSDSFYTAADDIAFYNSQLIDAADSLHIKSESTGNRILDFKTANNKHIIIDRATLPDGQFGTYFFNGVDSPKVVSTFDDNKQALKNYFKK